MKRDFAFADRYVATVDIHSQLISNLTSFGESLLGLREKQAINRGCYEVFGLRGLGPDVPCKRHCIPVQKFRADEVHTCLHVNISNTVEAGTSARVVGIPYVTERGDNVVDLYAWPNKESVSLVRCFHVQAFRRCKLYE